MIALRCKLTFHFSNLRRSGVESIADGVCYDECNFCVNNETEAPGITDALTDLGCVEPGKPLCNGPPGLGGDECFFCQNTEDGANTDLGCEDQPGKPIW